MKNNRRGGSYLEPILLGFVVVTLGASAGSCGYTVMLDRQVIEALAPKQAEESAEEIVEEETAPDAEKAQADENAPREDRGRRRGSRGAGRSTSNLPDELKQLASSKNLFGKANTTVKLDAILGNSALINGEWIEVGKENKGVRLVEVHANKVVLETGGQERAIQMWPAIPPGQAGPAVTAPPRANRSARTPGRPERGGGRFGGFRGGEIPPEMQALGEKMRALRQSGNADPEAMRKLQEEMREIMRSRTGR